MSTGHDIPGEQRRERMATRLGHAPGSGTRPAGMEAVLDVVRRGRRFAVCSHARPDGDAVGSMLACGMLLSQMGKQADLYSADPVPQIYRWLGCAETIRQTQRVEGDYDAAILLECDGIARTRLQGLEGRKLVSIDHHASWRAFADVNWIDEHACAVAEMVYRLARAAGVTVVPPMAACLYTAVLTDTGSFCYEGTDAHAFELARELVRCGAEPAAIAREVYFSNPLPKMVLLGTALTRLEREGRLAWLWVTHEDMTRAEAAEEDCEGIVNYAIGIAGVEAAVLVRELHDGKVRLSLRSKGDVDVALIAASFGGGGHRHAGGCTLEGPRGPATERILERMRRELAASAADRRARGESPGTNLLG